MSFPKDSAWGQEDERQRRYEQLRIGRIEQLTTEEVLKQTGEDFVKQAEERQIQEHREAMTRTTAVATRDLEQLSYLLNEAQISVECGAVRSLTDELHQAREIVAGLLQ